MAPSMVERPEETYLIGHSCKHCQQITFPGTPDESPEEVSGPRFYTHIPRYRLGISLNDMRGWSDCAFASHLLQHSDGNSSRFDNQDAIQLYAEMSPDRLEHNRVSLKWLEYIPSDEAVDEFERTHKRRIQYIHYLAATKQGQASFIPRKWQSKNRG